MKLLLHLCMRYAVIALMCALGACETTIQDPELPYVNQLVICGFANADSLVQRVCVMHTLPLTEDWSLEKALVRDASVRLEGPDSTITMIYSDAEQCYRTTLALQVGKRYILHVQWNELHADAIATVPQSPSVQSHGAGVRKMYYGDSSMYDMFVYDTAFVTWYSGSALGTIGSIVLRSRGDTLGLVMEKFRMTPDPFVQLYSTRSDGLSKLIVNAYTYYYQPRDSLIATKMQCVESSYLTIAGNSNNRDEIFGSFGTTPNANVSGDGFGFFVGLSSTTPWLISEIKIP